MSCRENQPRVSGEYAQGGHPERLEQQNQPRVSGEYLSLEWGGRFPPLLNQPRVSGEYISCSCVCGTRAWNQPRVSGEYFLQKCD